MNILSRLSSLLLALALLVGFFALIWLSVGQGLYNWRDTALSKREEMRSELQKLEGSLAALKRDHSQFGETGELTLIWAAKEAGAVTALIQSEISKLAKDHGVSLRAVTPAKESGLSLQEATGFRIEFEASLDQLTGFLQDIEYSSPALVVDRAVLRRLNKPGHKHPQPLVFAQIDLAAPIRLDNRESDK
ncbi:General secretion pathway protein M [Pelagimonas phthalicica]|uniref:General secretion pathway protein M n=1 Tax=Pelagimonas phthalicica TaxID=1037362 RepID=A0A238J715_9RHOB|nr:type II secretion system protein GspM [Pelagimonas phthalicica]TDS95443.1 type II secretion system (T2SS) protein M subtype b [Pelagimonas phthalicica]SMX26034.1 General secretion pathway protein M [Pelagimonas phthalicica]